MLCYIVYYTDYDPEEEWHDETIGIFNDFDEAVKAVEDRYGKKVKSWGEWFTIDETTSEYPYRVTIEPFMFFNRLKES